MKLGIYLLMLSLFWSIVILYTVHPVVPANPIELPFEDYSPLMYLMPQGWGFFTRDPRAEEVYAFVKNSSGAWQPAPTAQRSWPHLLTFSRRWKLRGMEIGLILEHVANPVWQECATVPTGCLSRAPLSGNVTAGMSRPSLCGEVGIARQEVVPWAWSQSAAETIMPSSVMRVHVSCRE